MIGQINETWSCREATLADAEWLQNLFDLRNYTDSTAVEVLSTSFVQGNFNQVTYDIILRDEARGLDVGYRKVTYAPEIKLLTYSFLINVLDHQSSNYFFEHLKSSLDIDTIHFIEANETNFSQIQTLDPNPEKLRDGSVIVRV